MADIIFEEIQPYVEGQGDTGKTSREKINRNFTKMKQGFSDFKTEVQEDLDSRDTPIVFTESKEMNAFIKHLFVDVSDCSVSYDTSNLYASFYNNGNGTIYISLWDAATSGNTLTGSLNVNKGNGVYCTRVYDTSNINRNNVYVYIEVNEELFPLSTISSRAKLTSWCFSPSCDPRLKDAGVTENPLINKYLTALYVDLKNYTGEFEEVKNGLRLYGLWNTIAQDTQYYLGFRDSDGYQRQLLSSNTKPTTIIDKSFDIPDKGKLRIVAKVNWDGLIGKLWSSQQLRLNPCVFERSFFYAIIEQEEDGGEDREVITIDSLKAQFSTRVFTKSAKHNQIIKKLFIDTSGYTGEADLSGGVKLSQLAKNISELHTHGIQLQSVNGNVGLGSYWIYSADSKQEKVHANGIYLYAEYDWNAFPEDTSKQYGAALLTNEAFNPNNDPRKSVGYSNLNDEVREMLNGQGGGGSGNGAITPLTGGVYGCVGDSITEGAGVRTNLPSSDTYLPLNPSNTTSKATYGYHIARVNRMSWYNYGISGSTLGDVTYNGKSLNGFAKANGRYTQLAANLTHISIFFGWNDFAYGHVMKREEWLLTEYGTKIYYPTESSLIGTTHTDGTPYATQSQYDACNSQTGTVNGVSYNNSSNYWRALYIGAESDTTPDTFWGAWNIVLPYLIDKYPLAKILVIVPYLSTNSEVAQLLKNAVRAAANKYGLCTYDFNAKDGQMFARGWSEISNVNGHIIDSADNAERTIQNFRLKNDSAAAQQQNPPYPSGDFLMYDATHPNENGYVYMYPSINAKLCSI